MFLNPLHLLGTEYVVLLSLVAREARQAVHDEAGNIVETMKPAAGQPGSRAAGQPGRAQKFKKHWFLLVVHVCGAQNLKIMCFCMLFTFVEPKT